MLCDTRSKPKEKFTVQVSELSEYLMRWPCWHAKEHEPEAKHALPVLPTKVGSLTLAAPIAKMRKYRHSIHK
jgi:hypothetical protein